MTDDICIEFGALAPNISEQLATQGVVIAENSANAFDDLARSLVLLHLHGLIPDSVRDNARKKLMKQIITEIRK
jgi:hypothetical protein